MADLQALLEWRFEVIENVFGVKPSLELMIENERYYLDAVSNGNHEAFIAAFDGQDVGCGGVCYSMELPSPDNPSGCCAYLMNIYVRKDFRQHGVAHEIVRHLIEHARRNNCGKIYLEATEEGKPVYRSLGFEDMDGMMKLKP